MTEKRKCYALGCRLSVHLESEWKRNCLCGLFCLDNAFLLLRRFFVFFVFFLFSKNDLLCIGWMLFCAN
jgi:hypothetical protein